MPNGSKGKGRPGKDDRPDPGWPGATMFKLTHVITVSPELAELLSQRPAERVLARIIEKLDDLKGQVKIMAQDLRERLAAIDANTTRTGEAVAVVAERIRVLSEQVASGKLTEAEYQEVAAELSRLAEFTGTVATNLEAVAHGEQEEPPIDPEDVPPVEP